MLMLEKTLLKGTFKAADSCGVDLLNESRECKVTFQNPAADLRTATGGRRCSLGLYLTLNDLQL